MPELPEVETIRKALQEGGREGPAIIGWQIKSIELLWNKTLVIPDVLTLRAEITGQRVQEIRRRAKFLDVVLDRHHLIFHLRMSGDIQVREAPIPAQKHDRFRITFDQPYQVIFNDPRKFGRIWFLSDPQELWAKLGPEPLDEVLTDEIFYQRLIQRRRQLKPLLMDQSFLAGMGNIYTDEVLFQAGLHPLQNSAEINREQAAYLLHAIRTQLKQGIERNGASIDWVYRGGSFQNTFLVYGKNGTNCSRCGTVIEKIMVGQRGTHFCPTCQQIFRAGSDSEEG